MDNVVPEKLNRSLVQSLSLGHSLLRGKKITAGFDGFVDTIVKIIREKKDDGTPVYFESIREFGDYVLEKQKASFSLELEEKSVKLGGNMPIMANALGHLGASVHCIGALGYPQTHAAFTGFSRNCNLYGFADPGFSTAYEFSDGKMLMASMSGINQAGWDTISEKIGLEKLIALYRESDMFCLLNWSEIDASTGIWKGLLQDVFPHIAGKNERTIFVDLSDCSKRPVSQLKEVLLMLQDFTAYGKLIFSLNRNEAAVIYRALFQDEPGDDLEKAASGIFAKLGIYKLVIHSAKEVIATDGKQTIKTGTFYTAQPMISTGAGDHFNAGFAAAELLNLDLDLSLLLANAVSGYYVRTAISAGIKELTQFIEYNKYGTIDL